MNLTLILVVMTGIISFQAFNNLGMRQKLLFHPYSVKQNGEYYRFLTHGFIHADMGHLLINMFVLYMFGDVIEPVFKSLFGATMGPLYFLLLYLGAIIIGALPAYIKHQNNSYYSSVGASGGTSAIVFAFILFDPWQWFLFPPLPALIFGIAYLWYSSSMSKKGIDNIGHDAHMWGAIYGFLLTLVLILITRPEILSRIIDRLLEGPGAPPFFG